MNKFAIFVDSTSDMFTDLRRCKHEYCFKRGRKESNSRLGYI